MSSQPLQSGLRHKPGRSQTRLVLLPAEPAGFRVSPAGSAGEARPLS